MKSPKSNSDAVQLMTIEVKQKNRAATEVNALEESKEPS